jgi:hypothetical protein
MRPGAKRLRQKALVVLVGLGLAWQMAAKHRGNAVENFELAQDVGLRIILANMTPIHAGAVGDRCSDREQFRIVRQLHWTSPGRGGRGRG